MTPDFPDPPGEAEMRAHVRRLSEALLDAFTAHGPEGLTAARDRWKAMADQLPLRQRRQARLALRMALEQITNP